MIEFSITEISEIINGKLIKGSGFQNKNISKIIIDSRSFFKQQNSCFFALTGPRNNGHVYIPELIEKGIDVFVVSEKATVKKEAAFILVEDTKKALQKLAEFNRNIQDYPVIGITGSNGKTIVKEWLNEILSESFKIVRSPKSYNSQVGVPLSVLLMNSNYNLAIIEAGISMPDEMQNLKKIISPDIGIFTNIGDAHQENFDTITQKINEKLLLFQESKQLIFNTDSEILRNEAEAFCKKHSIERISWTLNNHNDALISYSAKIIKEYTQITAKINNEEFRVQIPFTDRSSIENTCHCFAAGWVLLKKPDRFIKKFIDLNSVAMRLEIKHGINNCILVNDYYNSDLNSFAIALSVLHQQAAKEHRHKVVILSDIQQTGLSQTELYKKVNDLLHEWNIDKIIGIGPEISAHSEDFKIEKEFYQTTNDFISHFNKNRYTKSAILIKGARQFAFENISVLLQQKAHQTQLEINLNALTHNLNIYKSLLKPDTKIMVMVKAFSYGSGDVEIAKLLQYQNIDYLAVAVADEGVQLRNKGIHIPIIVMNPEQHSFQNIIDYQLEPNIYSLELLNDFLKSVHINGLNEFPVHLKIDTGMNRLGIKSKDEIKSVISTISSNNQVKIKSVFSHLAASDDPALDNFTQQQFDYFEECTSIISESFKYKIDRHILNSAGIERFPKKQYDMVRLGIGLYGISNTGLPVESIGTLKSTVSQVKHVKAGETVGYNRKGEITSESKVAIVPLGYADGLDRKLGNGNGRAFVNGKSVPIIGNICMDMLMLDVTETKVNPGDKVEFFGSNISISEVAQKASTIPYEILTGISQRVKRVYLQE